MLAIKILKLVANEKRRKGEIMGAEVAEKAIREIESLQQECADVKREITELRAELETTKHVAEVQTEAAIDYQQENEQLKKELATWKYETQCHMDIVAEKCKEVEKLQRLIMAQNGALVKARDLVYNNMPYAAGTVGYKNYLEALEQIDKAIGGWRNDNNT